ncbi:hypothetical protein VPNG_01378 [Cytospora leucostoma]|uniref:Uncharacterized protein n=1 Tax=Cytospora leucostoma TaxID=1230097 RepID=A0A423XL58_9PEZI|nr:hypothetical protein VPNG_01378 [Cytospora leucostoma]
MKFYTILLAFLGIVLADMTARAPEVTEVSVLKPRDIIDSFDSALDGIGSTIANVASTLASDAGAAEFSALSAASSDYARITSAAAAASSTLGSELSTATGAAVTSIKSLLSEIGNSASAALETVSAEAANVTASAASSPSSSSIAGGAAIQTAAVGIGALMGAAAFWANIWN